MEIPKCCLDFSPTSNVEFQVEALFENTDAASVDAGDEKKGNFG
jgi:hypothetical protein